MSKLDPRIVTLYNDYIHSTLPRREFMSRLVKLTGSVAAASPVLPRSSRGVARFNSSIPT